MSELVFLQWAFRIAIAVIGFLSCSLYFARREQIRRDRTIAQLYEIKADYEAAMKGRIEWVPGNPPEHPFDKWVPRSVANPRP